MKVEQPISIPTSVPTLNATTPDGLTVNGIIVPVTIPITVTLNALSVSTAVFVADVAYQVTGIKALWGVAGGAGATLNIEKLTGTTAPGAGIALLTSNLDLTSAANTVNTGTLTGTVADLQLAAGDRLGCKLAGVLTGLVGCVVTVFLKRI